MAPTLILIGFMGSGKTAVGKRVARVLGWDFHDTDSLIEQEAGKSINDIFVHEGESAFRVYEERVVRRVLDESADAVDGSVLSLGGGAVTISKVKKQLLDEELVVLLEEDLKTAYRRSRNGKRPLAKSREEFEKLYEQRENLYRAVARQVVETRGRNVKQVADEVIRKIGEGKGAG